MALGAVTLLGWAYISASTVLDILLIGSALSYFVFFRVAAKWVDLVS